MAMCRAEVQVETLKPMRQMPGVDSWRTVDRFVLTGATEHGLHKMMLFNQHQPKSNNYKVGCAQQLNFCKAIFREGIRFMSKETLSVGFGFGVMPIAA